MTSYSNILFPDWLYHGSISIQGHPYPADRSPSLTLGNVTPGFFDAMHIPILRGRVFTDADTMQNAPRGAIINERAAHIYWPTENPIGTKFKWTDPNFQSPWFTIVGVIGDIHQEGLEKSAIPMVYAPGAADYRDYLVVRASGHPKSLLAAVRAQVEAIDRRLAIDQFGAASEILSAPESQRKFSSRLLGIFALLALALAAVGIYGTVSHWINERTQEIGIRMALGAQRREVLGLVIWQGVKLAVAGEIIEIAGALALTRFLSSLLFDVKPADPMTFIAVSLILTGVASLSCYIPARRAAEMDPVVALRHE